MTRQRRPDAAEALSAGVLVPAGATVVEASGPAACTTQPIEGATIATSDLGDLAAGAGAEVTVTIEVDAPAGSTLALTGALVSPTHDAVPGGRLAEARSR